MPAPPARIASALRGELDVERSGLVGGDDIRVAGEERADRLAHAPLQQEAAEPAPGLDEEEALALANATESGLAAYLYTRDLGRAWRMGGPVRGARGRGTGWTTSSRSP